MSDLQFGVIGVGHFGQHYVRLLQEIPGAELLMTANNAQETEALLADLKVDCVVIATPASTHFGIAKAAIEAGKNVLVEKPMVLNRKDAESLEAVVKKREQVFMVGHQYLYNDHVRYLKQQIESGVFGKVHYMFAQHLYSHPPRKDMGVFWDASPHAFSIIDFIFGPVKVKRVEGLLEKSAGSKFDDSVKAEVLFDSGLILKINLSRLSPEKTNRLSISGERGEAFYDDVTKEVKLKSGEADWNLQKIVASEPLRNEVEHFIECVQNAQTPVTDIEHGARVVSMLEAVYKKLIIEKSP